MCVIGTIGICGLRAALMFDAARTRKQYRLIQKEKKRLEEAGIDLELVENC